MELMIDVFGVGSARDIVMLRSLNMALEDLVLKPNINYITDIHTFVTLGLSGIPALMINEKMVAAGRIPSVPELKQLILAEMETRRKLTNNGIHITKS